jgi:hypothetical protein
LFEQFVIRTGRPYVRAYARTMWSLAALVDEYGLEGSYRVSSVKKPVVEHARPAGGVHAAAVLGGLPVLARDLEEVERALHVRAHELARPEDRAIDVGLGCEVHDEVGRLFGREPVERVEVADVRVREPVVVAPGDGLERERVRGVRELVDVHEAALGRPRHVAQEEARPDEAGPAGDPDVHVLSCSSRRRASLG